MRPVLVKGGRVIDPSRQLDRAADVLIQDGRIAAVESNVTAPEGAETIDASGMVVAPGLVDVHVHLREPGKEEAETVATGARAAAAGGFTSVCAMPNTDPITDNQAAIGFIVKQANAANGARVFPYGAISIGQQGEHLAEYAKLIEAGAIAFSDDGHPVLSSHLMRTALEYAQAFGIPVADHCEEPSLARGGAMHDGVVSTRLGLKGIPAAAEEIMVARDVILSELTGGHVHLCHISTKGSVDIIRRGKENGVNVTAEVTPHHLTLTHEECEGYNTNAKMNPPLREEADVVALREALKDGTLDMIATDHAPHQDEAKERDFDDAPFGIVGLETALGLGVKELVNTGVLSLLELMGRMSTEPAKAFHLDAGTLEPGKPADLVIFDPGATWTVDPTEFHSKSRNTPYTGHVLAGRVERTIVGGRTVFQRDS
ncbi:MAG: dihydroorotase [Gemmatimonadales bacterium]